MTAPTAASDSTLLMKAAAASVPKRCTSAISPSSRLTKSPTGTRARRRGETRRRCEYTAPRSEKRVRPEART